MPSKILKSFLTVICLIAITLNLSACNNLAKEENHTEKTLVNWYPEWNDKIFEEAKLNKKPILLSLEANWCHWCHVMKEKNYNNPAIANLINSNFIPVAVDQDNNPYLSNLYKDYGWPATIIFSPDGEEIAKLTGFVETEEFKTILEKVTKDPYKVLDQPKKAIAYSKESILAENLKKQLSNNFKNSTDMRIGGLKIAQKYLDRDTIEYALTLISHNVDREIATKIAKVNFDNAVKLQDNQAGGFYQYSTQSTWSKPHKEKLTEIQAEYIRAYSYAYLILGDQKYLDTAKKAAGFMLSSTMKDPSGAFYSSQDADLINGKRPVNKNTYPNKNGLMIEALVDLYKASKDPKYLSAAENAAKAMLLKFKKSEAKNTMYFIHTEKDKNIYLADSLYMSRAFLSLYEATANRDWLYKSISVADFIKDKFRNQDAGYITSILDPKNSSSLDKILKSKPILAENIKLARLFNLLNQYSANPIYKQEAEHIMKFLNTEEIALDTLTEPGILLVDFEMTNDPIHYTLVASKKDLQAQKLFKQLLSCPFIYSRIEWYDSKEGKLLNHDVEYPDLGKAAVFSCMNKTCSIPMYEVAELQENLKVL